MEKDVLKNWLLSLFAFNLIDTATTILFLSNQLGHEYNPVVRFLYGIHPGVFLIFKMAIGWFAIGLYASGKEISKSARLTIIASTVFYGLLSLYQLAVVGLWLAQ